MLQRLKHSSLMTHYPAILRWYMIIFISYSLTGWLGPFNLFLPAQQAVSTTLAAVGGLLLLLDLLTNRSCLKVPHNRWLLAFLAIFAISIILNASYGWAGNIKALYWQILQVGLFVPLYLILDDDQRQKGFRILFWVIFVLITVVNLISVIWFFSQYSAVFVDAMGKIQRLGFIDGRNFGLYIDPNYGGVVSVCVMLATCYYLLSRQTTRATRILLGASLVLNWYFTISTFSRIGPTCGIAAAIVWLTLHLRNRRNAAKQPLAASSSQNRPSLLRSVLLGCGLVLVLVASYFAVSTANISYASWAHSVDLFGSASREQADGPQWYAGPIDHGLENVSNNRFAIWQDYLTFSLDDPLFGKSPRNVMVQVLEDHPDSYIAGREYGPHSGYVSVINATGWLGFAVWLALFGFFVRGLIGYLRRHRQVSAGFILALTLLLVLLMKAAVNETLFFSYSFYASLFYIILGGLLVLFEKDKDKTASRSPAR